MDALVAKALNSTVGTDDFSGLDEVLTKKAFRLQPSDKVFYHYDDTYTVTQTGGSSGSTTATWTGYSKYIKFDVDGNANATIIFNASAVSSSNNISVGLQDENGKSLFGVSGTRSSITDTEVKGYLKVDKSKKYRVYFTFAGATSTTMKITDFDIYASPVHGAVFAQIAE